jgi:hypothetical protein
MSSEDGRAPGAIDEFVGGSGATQENLSGEEEGVNAVFFGAEDAAVDFLVPKSEALLCRVGDIHSRGVACVRALSRNIQDILVCRGAEPTSIRGHSTVESERDVVVAIDLVPQSGPEHAQSFKISYSQAVEANISFLLPLAALRPDLRQHSQQDESALVNAWALDLLSRLHTESSDGGLSAAKLHPQEKMTRLAKMVGGDCWTCLAKKGKIARGGGKLLVSIHVVTGRKCALHISSISASSGRHFAYSVGVTELPFEWCRMNEFGKMCLTPLSSWPEGWVDSMLGRLTVDTVAGKMVLVALSTSTEEHDKAARRLQSQQRGFLARKEVHRLREKKKKSIALKQQQVSFVEEGAATTIQAPARQKSPTAQAFASSIRGRGLKEGSNVLARYCKGKKFYRGTIANVRKEETYDIAYNDGGKEFAVAADLIRACDENGKVDNLEGVIKNFSRPAIPIVREGDDDLDTADGETAEYFQEKAVAEIATRPAAELYRNYVLEDLFAILDEELTEEDGKLAGTEASLQWARLQHREGRSVFIFISL